MRPSGCYISRRQCEAKVSTMRFNNNQPNLVGRRRHFGTYYKIGTC